MDIKTNRAYELTLSILTCLTAFSVDVCIPAIPDIARSLAVDPGASQLIIGAFLIGYVVNQIPMGLASDRYGRRPVIAVGLVVFVVSGIVAATASSLDTLLWARFFQGMAGGVGPIMARAIASDVASGVALGKLVSRLIVALSISTIIAPLVGSALVEWFSWRAPVYASVSLGVLCMVLIAAFVAESHSPSLERNKVFEQLGHSFRAFLSSRQSIWASLLLGFSFFGYASIIAGLSSILVDVYDVSTANIGPIFVIVIGFYLLGAQLGGRLVSRLGYDGLLRTAIVLYAVAGFGFATIAWAGMVGLITLCAMLSIFLLGFGIAYSIGSALALEPLGNIAGMASAIVGTVQMSFAALGAAVAAMLYQQDVSALASTGSLACIAVICLFVLGGGRAVRSKQYS